MLREHEVYGPITDDVADELSTSGAEPIETNVEKARAHAITACAAVKAQKMWTKLDRSFGPGDIEERDRVLELLIKRATEARQKLATYETAVILKLEPATAHLLTAAEGA